MLHHADLLRSLSYCVVTGTWRWKVSPRYGVLPGDIAGSVNARGYRYVHLNGVNYRSNRLAVFYVTGEWPSGQVDHKNRKTGIDKIGNLRAATCSQNQANRGKNRNNTSGFKGVSFSRRDRKWRAQICVNRKVRNLGSFANPADAHAAYLKAADAAFGQFAGS